MYVQATQKCYIRTRTAQLGEIQEEKHRTIIRKNEWMALLLFLTSIPYWTFSFNVLQF